MIRRMGQAFKAFWRVLRPQKKSPGALREFVYLDEISVESLLASLDGEIVTGVTQSRTKGRQFGIAATGAAVGVPTGLSPSWSSSRSVTVEEQRKSVAQSTFARFRNRHYKNLRIKVPERVGDGPIFADNYRVPAADLNRGDLIEVDAELGASEVFQVRAVIESMIGVVDAYPDLIGASELAAIREAAPIGDLLGNLSQGLIPIEGRVEGLRYVTNELFEGIVSASEAERMESDGAVVRDVIVSGVSLEPLFWQDVRRVLFSQQTFRVLGRLVNTGGRDSWSSLKITEVLSRVNAQIADTINAFGPMFLNTLQEAGSESVPAAESEVLSEESRPGRLMAFAKDYAELVVLEWTDNIERDVQSRLSAIDSMRHGAEYWRELQDAVIACIACDVVLDGETLLELRSRHQEPVASQPAPAEIRPSPIAERAAIFLEIEIIAIYW